MNTFGCKSITKNVNQKTILKNISLQVNTGQVIAILGPNGAGKTTTFSILTGITKPSSGIVFLNNMNISTLPMYQRSKLGIGYLPQENSLFQDFTVEENILSILEFQKKSKTERKHITQQLLKDFNLSHIAKEKASVLSGGERRKLEIARALSLSPKFLLLDEPFAGVDPIAIEDIKKIILNLKEKNIGVIITDHNIRETMPISDYIYIVYSGEILTHDTYTNILNNTCAIEKYFGNSFNQ